jgi:hypothetical protein
MCSPVQFSRNFANLILFFGFIACQSSPRTTQDSPVPKAPFEGMEAGWHTVTPGGDSGCATGTPFQFHIRPGKTDKVVFFLNGGGACWNAELCALDIDPVTYRPYSTDDGNDPRMQQGIFDLEHTENPVADWTIVYVPYCTGDVHLGGFDRSYSTKSGKEILIQHRGKQNVATAYEWLFGKLGNPETVLVCGSSAGAIAAPYYAMLLAEKYPKADVIALADGAGGYRSDQVVHLMEAWGVETGMPAVFKKQQKLADFEDLFSLAYNLYPHIKFAQINAAHDQVQVDFLNLMGVKQPLFPLLKANLTELEDEIVGFTSYTFAGNEHTVLRYDRFYTISVGGKKLVDWFSELLNNQNPDPVACEQEGNCNP